MDMYDTRPYLLFRQPRGAMTEVFATISMWIKNYTIVSFTIYFDLEKYSNLFLIKCSEFWLPIMKTSILILSNIG